MRFRTLAIVTVLLGTAAGLLGYGTSTYLEAQRDLDLFRDADIRDVIETYQTHRALKAALDNGTLAPEAVGPENYRALERLVEIGEEYCHEFVTERAMEHCETLTSNPAANGTG